jgi:hypothetical protein
MLLSTNSAKLGSRSLSGLQRVERLGENAVRSALLNADVHAATPVIALVLEIVGA